MDRHVGRLYTPNENRCCLCGFDFDEDETLVKVMATYHYSALEPRYQGICEIWYHFDCFRAHNLH